MFYTKAVCIYSEMRGVIYKGFKTAIRVRRLSVQSTGIVQNTDRCPYSASVLFRIRTGVRTVQVYCSEYRLVFVQCTGIIQNTEQWSALGNLLVP
jgi:hypothetical protein